MGYENGMSNESFECNSYEEADLLTALKKYSENLTESNVADVTINFNSGRF